MQRSPWYRPRSSNYACNFTARPLGHVEVERSLGANSPTISLFESRPGRSLIEHKTSSRAPRTSSPARCNVREYKTYVRTCVRTSGDRLQFMILKKLIRSTTQFSKIPTKETSGLSVNRALVPLKTYPPCFLTYLRSPVTRNRFSTDS